MNKKICQSCNENYFIESPGFPGLCPLCGLNAALFGVPKSDGTRSKGILNHK